MACNVFRAVQPSWPLTLRMFSSSQKETPYPWAPLIPALDCHQIYLFWTLCRNRILYCLVFYDWFLSRSIMCLRFICVVTVLVIHSFLWLRNIPLWEYPWLRVFVCLHVSWWTLGLFLSFSSDVQCCCEHSWTGFCVDLCFHFFRVDAQEWPFWDIWQLCLTSEEQSWVFFIHFIKSSWRLRKHCTWHWRLRFSNPGPSAIQTHIQVLL